MKENETGRDIAILSYILNKEGATRKEVAKHTGIPDSTVQRRLAALQESGDLINHYILGPENKFFLVRALIGVKLKTNMIECEAYNYHNQIELACFIKWGLVRCPEFSDIMANVVLERVEQAFGGPYELILIVSALNPNACAEFVTSIIQKLPGVIETNTSSIVSHSTSKWKPRQTPNQAHKDKPSLPRRQMEQNGIMQV